MPSPASDEIKGRVGPARSVGSITYLVAIAKVANRCDRLVAAPQGVPDAARLVLPSRCAILGVRTCWAPDGKLKGRQQLDQTRKARSVRVHQLSELPDPITALRRKAQLGPARDHHTPLKSEVPTPMPSDRDRLGESTARSGSRDLLTGTRPGALNGHGTVRAGNRTVLRSRGTTVGACDVALPRDCRIAPRSAVPPPGVARVRRVFVPTLGR
jgi:hypothetical protein